MSRRGRNNLTEESIFFVTTTVVKFANVFINDKYCNILIENIKHYQKKYNFTILAYVIMPSHFHWIVMVDNNKGTISDIMRDIKKYSAWDIMEELEKNDKKTECREPFRDTSSHEEKLLNISIGEPLHDKEVLAPRSGSKLTTFEAKLTDGHKPSHDFISDEAKLLSIFRNEGALHKNHKRKFWMKRFDDEVIRNNKIFWTKLKYIHNNPVKAGLVSKPEDYKYSSAKNYILGDHSVITVDTEYAGIEFN